MKTRAEVVAFLSGYYTGKFGGKVWASWDNQKRAYFIRGDSLPAARSMRKVYPNGWSLLDYIKPAKARALMA